MEPILPFKKFMGVYYFLNKRPLFFRLLFWDYFYSSKLFVQVQSKKLRSKMQKLCSLSTK
jgi:hypothetical protein